MLRTFCSSFEILRYWQSYNTRKVVFLLCFMHKMHVLRFLDIHVVYYDDLRSFLNLSTKFCEVLFSDLRGFITLGSFLCRVLVYIFV